jgi:hypothetical protein
VGIADEQGKYDVIWYLIEADEKNVPGESSFPSNIFAKRVLLKDQERFFKFHAEKENKVRPIILGEMTELLWLRLFADDVYIIDSGVFVFLGLRDDNNDQVYHKRWRHRRMKRALGEAATFAVEVHKLWRLGPKSLTEYMCDEKPDLFPIADLQGRHFSMRLPIIGESWTPIDQMVAAVSFALPKKYQELMETGRKMVREVYKDVHVDRVDPKTKEKVEWPTVFELQILDKCKSMVMDLMLELNLPREQAEQALRLTNWEYTQALAVAVEFKTKAEGDLKRMSSMRLERQRKEMLGEARLVKHNTEYLAPPLLRDAWLNKVARGSLKNGEITVMLTPSGTSLSVFVAMEDIKTRLRSLIKKVVGPLPPSVARELWTSGRVTDQVYEDAILPVMVEGMRGLDAEVKLESIPEKGKVPAAKNGKRKRVEEWLDMQSTWKRMREDLLRQRVRMQPGSGSVPAPVGPSAWNVWL